MKTGREKFLTGVGEEMRESGVATEKEARGSAARAVAARIWRTRRVAWGAVMRR